MSSITFAPTFGLGDIQRAALRQIFQGVNVMIDLINMEKAVEDVEFETFLEREEPAATVVEHIAAENFHEGHRPSLIAAPITKYPNCCVWTVRAVPNSESAGSDHTSIFSNLLYIEVMVKATPDEDEETVNRRIERTAEAVHICLMRDQSLGGRVSGFVSEPTINLSDVFTRKEKTAYGPHWFWQGARLEYTIRKDSVLPGAQSGPIFQAVRQHTSPYEGLNIDQM